MRLIHLERSSQYFIRAPLALTGPDLSPEENVLLEIKGGLIASLQSMPESILPPSFKNRDHFFCLDRGLTLLPCLIDAHIHIALDGEDFNRSKASWDNRELLLPRIERDCANYLQAGVGIVRDGGDLQSVNLKIKKVLRGENGKARRGPRIVSTGEAVRRKDGYGSFLGRGYSSPGEIPVLIERLWSSGIDQLKVIASGIVGFTRYGEVGGALPAPEELAAMISHARKRDLPVMAHASSDAAVDLVVRAGVNTVEHGYFVSRETLKRMADQQTAWVPTIIPVAAQAGEMLHGLRGRREIEIIRRTYQDQVAKLELAHSIGVPLGVGTDSGAAGVRHGESLVEEILLYAGSSLPYRAILKAATAGNAAILGLGNKAGSIQSGFRPHLVAVRGNPLHDLAVLKEVAVHFVPV